MNEIGNSCVIKLSDRNSALAFAKSYLAILRFLDILKRQLCARSSSGALCWDSLPARRAGLSHIVNGG